MLKWSQIWPVGAPSSWLLCLSLLAHVFTSGTRWPRRTLPVPAMDSAIFAKNLWFFFVGSDIRVQDGEARCALPHYMSLLMPRQWADQEEQLLYVILAFQHFISVGPFSHQEEPGSQRNQYICSFAHFTLLINLFQNSYAHTITNNKTTNLSFLCSPFSPLIVRLRAMEVLRLKVTGSLSFPFFLNVVFAKWIKIVKCNCSCLFPTLKLKKSSLTQLLAF